MNDRVMERVALEGVPRIGFDIHLSPFPGTLYSCLSYLGAPSDYDYIMGVTGAAFRRFWNRDDGGNVDLFYLGDEPARRVFEALGFGWEWVAPEREAMLEAIKESIARGVPAIAFGIIGPPEAGLVTGHSAGGEVLYGWSYFQEGREAYYERANWFATMEKGSHANQGVIVIEGPLGTRPAPRTVYTDALHWAVKLETASTWPGVADHVAGLAAYSAWSDALEIDADYPVDDPTVLGVRVMVHGDQSVMLEERGNAARFLRQAVGVLPEAASELEAAAELYGRVQGQMAGIWPWDSSMGPATQQKLARPDARRGIACAVREAGRLETEAVSHLQAALAALGA